MRIYSLHHDTDNKIDGVSFFHCLMCHGIVLPHPGVFGAASHEFGVPTDYQLELMVNGLRLADVIYPYFSNTNLVISEKVYRDLKPVQKNFDILPVSFKKVFSLPWSLESKYDLSKTFAHLIDDGRQMSIFEQAIHDSELARTIPAYYEIAGPNHYRLLDEFPATHQFLTKTYKGEPMDMDYVGVSAALFHEYPITDAGFPIIRDELFEILKPYLSPSFFWFEVFEF